MRCVVCGGAVGNPCYANPWEKARELYACCSDACARRFDADTHWLPATKPAPASDTDEVRLLAGGNQRLKAGDRPALVVRDLLLAGIAIRAIRKLLFDAKAQATMRHRSARQQNILGIISGVLGGRWWFARSRDRRDPKLLDAAHADLAAWSARFDAPM